MTPPSRPAPSWRPRLRAAARAAAAPFCLAAGALIYALARLLEPLKRVQFGLIRFDRIGHLAGNTETFLRARALGLEDPGNLCVFFTARPANRQLLDMIKRRLTVFESLPARWLFDMGLWPLVKGTRFEQPLHCGSNEYHKFNAAPSQLRSTFTEEELERGRRELAALGVPAGAPFVCFHSRDKAYLSGDAYSYHDYRDCEIANYLPAAEWLAGRGLYALRMGASVEKPLSSPPPRVIDYACSGRSDFLDVFLIAHCRFWLGNTAGTTSVAYAFDVPVAEANLAPLAYPPWRRGDLFLPKTYRDARSGAALPFREVVARGLYDCQDGRRFESAGILVEENSAQDILDLAQEMHGRLEGTWRDEAGDEQRQERYRSLFPKGGINDGCPARVAAAFLRRREALLA